MLARPIPQPSYPALPYVDTEGRSSVSGVSIAGELAGTPLIKLGLNAGAKVADRIADELVGADRSRDASQPSTPETRVHDLIVVGAGSAGLAAAARAQRRGLSVLVLEAGRWGQTVRDMYQGKLLFAEPLAVENTSDMWFEECSRETLLARWQEQIRILELDLREQQPVVNLRRAGACLQVDTDTHSHRARRVLLAIGKAGHPRVAGAAGEREHADKLAHSLSDPDAHHGQDILIYGGGDVAVEAALRLRADNRVTLVTIDAALTFPRKRNREALQAAVTAGELTVHLNSELSQIEREHVVFRDRNSDQQHRVDNDLVFEMIGSELPLGFFRRAGIQLENAWNARRYLWLILALGMSYTLYALKKYPEAPYSWPFNRLIDAASFERAVGGMFEVAFLPFAWMFETRALAEMRATLWFQQGYLYSLLYTIVMVTFGIEALRRWTGIARNPRYQKYRYATLLAFQVGFFLIANIVAVQALSIQHAWRAWGLYQPFPLFFNTFHWLERSDPAIVLYGFVGAGLLGTFVAIPLAAHRHGKRFCTWICGCGGLAETLGDRYRHLSAKGPRSRAWEFQSVAVLAVACLCTLITVGAFDTRADNGWAATYSYLVDFWLVAVIPIGIYPFFGGKVWCRYWCPLAAYNGLLARWYGKLEIRANDKCISCTQCSRECQVGVDVMAFAKQGLPLDNTNSSCIQCGICIDVCPMDVLSFGQRDQREAATRGKRRLPLTGRSPV